MFRVNKASKRGFTLLETMLSVALLLIVTLIVYEGFMTTLNYAGDTALAERVSNQNAGTCYRTMGQETTSLHPGTTSTAIMVSGTGYKGVFQVHAFAETGGMSIFSSGSSFTDDANFLNTTNRHGFVYKARMCPSCSGVLGFFQETSGGNIVYVAKCTEPSCTYSAAFS
ncbi:MAG: type II secretion system protein [Clostridiales bacterium]|nr:type II secretion system protein [Clostridiales bacterium]MBR5417243.1 type II secretion system protein [Clostridiales bacterium]